MAKAPTPTWRAGTSSSGQRGFTFIELAVVLILLGIVLVMLVPNFGPVVGGSSARSAALRMHGLIATVHDKAALQKRCYWLGMELGTGDYWALATEPGEAVSREEIIDRKDRAPIKGSLPADAVFEDVFLDNQELKEGVALTRFEPNGTCDDAQIHLADDGGGVATVSIDPWTGRCTVSNSYAVSETAKPGAKEGEAAAGGAAAEQQGQAADGTAAPEEAQ